MVVVFRDVSLARQMAEQLAYQATHDALTGLPNRQLFVDRFEQTVAHVQRNKQRLALLFLDLDNFKQVNDNLGHAIGDQLLQQVAERLRHCVRAGDTVCRQGGDEFLVLIEAIDNPDQLLPLVEKLLATNAEPYQIKQHTLTLTSSIGISVYPDDGVEINDLVKHADAAMYAAKTSGRNCFQFFTPNLTSSARSIH
jgi:diguanylate cyclase (GGDEF)-like protein